MWNGKGFPPVGTVCEFKYFGDWKRGTVVTSSDNACSVSNGMFGILTISVSDIRPIKSAVEIGNAQADWNGKGFPPAGVKCEVKYRNKWVPCHVIGMDDLGNCVVRHDMEYLTTQLTEHFRPLRTERRIVKHLEIIQGWVSINHCDVNVEIEIDKGKGGSCSAFLTREQATVLRDVLEDLLK